MTDKEKVSSVLEKIDAMLSLDFMTEPVRQELTNIKTTLIAVRDNL